MGMAKLVKRLSLPEAVGLSVSVICPTVTAAFNITLVVQAAGAAAPLAFAIGTVATALVALSFMAFTHRVAHAGSAYAYIAHTFGSRMGFVEGWGLLFSYPFLRPPVSWRGWPSFRVPRLRASGSTSARGGSRSARPRYCSPGGLRTRS